LKRRLDGDLGWIIMKALEKDPARRYQSASDLAGDLGRLRALQPVDAGPPSRRYRAGRFVQRHRTAVIAASVVMAALLAGMTLATVGFVRAKHAQRVAEAEAKRATTIKDFLTGILAESRPDKSKGREITVKEAVDSAAVRLDRDKSFADDPLTKAHVVHAIAETYRSMDAYDRATPLFERAVKLKRSAPGNNEATILVSLNKLSECEAETGDLKKAIATQKEVVALTEKLNGKETDLYSARLDNLGNMYADSGDLAKAEIILRESLAIDRRVLKPDDSSLPYSINNLATILVDEGKCADAIPLHEESLAMRHRLFKEPSDEMANALANYARALDCDGRYGPAGVFADSALTMSITVFGDKHQRTASARVRVAEVLLHTGRAKEAEPLLHRAIETFRGLGERHWRVGDARARLGEVWMAEGQGAKGVAELEAGWQILTETTGPNTRRAKEIAGMAAKYYQTDPGESERWMARANGMAAQ
jgi:tetratricopeptide (TPR) repeat protein